MRVLPFLAALLCTTPLANAKSELELLQDRCAEMERQIRALENENSQLKSQTSVSTKTVVSTAKPVAPSPTTSATKAAKPSAPVASKPVAAGPTYATVRPGDTLVKVAKRNGTTSTTLLKLNKLKNPSLIRPGEKLRLPDKAPVAIAKTAPAPAQPAPVAAPKGGTHIVKSGETFYSIARHYGMSTEALQASNPHIEAGKMRAGQTLHLGAAAPATAQSKPASEKKTAASAPAPKTAATTHAAEPEPAPKQATPPASKFHLVVIDEPINFGAFAAAHGTTTDRLNALNGHNLNPSQVLAKESAFYVPAQP